MVLSSKLDQATVIKGFLFMLSNDKKGIDPDFNSLVNDEVSLVYGDLIQS